MNALDLYALIEQHLGFEDEIGELYNFYKNFTIKNNLNSLIDIGCGQGNFLLSLPKNIQTFGTDLSIEQIKVCQNKNLNAQAIDIRDVTDNYQIATAIFDVLNYLPKIELKKFIKSVYDLLEDDGYFLFDINTLFGFEEIAQGSLNINKDDKFIAIDAFYDNKQLKTHINLFSKQEHCYQRQENHITQYFHSIDDIKNILEKNNFQIISIEDFYLHSQDEADKNIFIAQKIA